MITDWLDNSLRYFATLQGRPVEEYSAEVGGEGIATALEWAADQFAKPFLSTLLQFAAAVLAGSYATWGQNVATRTRRELAAISIHEGLRVTKVLHYPLNIEVRRNMEDLMAAAQRGDMQGALAAVLRSPSELQSMFASFAAAPSGNQVPVVERAGPYTPAPTPEIRGDHIVGPAFGERSVPYGALVGQAPFGVQATVGRFTATEEMPYGQQSTGQRGRFS